jgi:8-oxo-dGTP pyrophosphatase MutT (NUDIX family)
MGASILPVTFHNNKILFLFGKERDIDETPGWSDFGGGTDNNESFIQTAIREGSEELTGFLGNATNIRDMLYKHGTYNINYKSTNHSTYRCHIFPIMYDPKLPIYYNNNQQFLQQKLDNKIIENTKIFEKTRIQWFSFDEIKTHYTDFRSFYKHVVDLILLNRHNIETFIKKSLQKKAKINQTSKKSKTKKINKV